ncbi:phosphatases II [Sodiomyces alkalinus F11]|uniref:Phosphatases II n=1 Tax=Sodiomyces alkalinus (strain CBS 110278 / VKM F-3762 / F11) TaxID=1314773 RepID=A0A3N2PMR6_SODAK|nr:phosphatases II [Sodiomyces alkalinus F11]ROT35822.1 phosphatases II [Sodiomyces alkalinus F11]
MEIPKFRRKPKQPTIVTDTRALTPRESPDSSPSTMASPGAKSFGQLHPLRKGPFRNFHLRSATKRARSPAAPPSPLPSSSPLSTRTSIQEGAAIFASSPPSPVSVRHRDGQAVDSRNSRDARKKPKMPFFLDQPLDAIEEKFIFLPFAIPPPVQPDSDLNSTSPYNFYRQTDMRRGVMDRYTNIKPYNHNRVRLRVPDSTLDYVNASPVTLPAMNENLPPLRYIAMQGPTRLSIDFVWRMLAEQTRSENPVVIVQLTTMIEGQHEKCFPYLPMSPEEGPWVLNRNDGWEDGWRAELRCESVQELEGGAIELRKLVLRVDPPESRENSETDEDDEHDEDEEDGGASLEDGEDEERVKPEEWTIWHFYYTRWPDFGAPALEDVESFLALMRLSRDYNTGKAPQPDGATSERNGNDVPRSRATESTGQEKKKEKDDQEEANPRIIHCSAGVGRTGTFITLEHLKRELDAGTLENYDGSLNVTLSSGGGDDSDDDAFPDPIVQTVEKLREQRLLMVQSPDQFLFLYQTLRQMWLHRYGPLVDDPAEGFEERAPKRLEVGDPYVD